MDENCLFCKIIKGEIPSSKVYEDDEMTSEEEELVANAIKNQTNVEKIVEILNKKQCK